MTTYLIIEEEQKKAPEWANLSFAHVAEKIKEGLISCPELEKHYAKQFDEAAKAYEIQCFTSH
ncbi:hypothetical protein [Runella sp.]|uniref:hypothetical protein n=1 Tax=Runella sp. TaxID=1960881 RepID=UPI003D0B9F49